MIEKYWRWMGSRWTVLVHLKNYKITNTKVIDKKTLYKDDTHFLYLDVI